jgi:cytoplasmic iron level regulating protein YaaA (DUF328/UPF0246 family)
MEKYHQKLKLKIKIKITDFGGFWSPEVMEKKGKIVQFKYLVSLCSQKYRKMITFIYLFKYIYNHIW